MTSRCSAIGFSTAIGAASGPRAGNSAASHAEFTKLKVIASCQSRSTSARFSAPGVSAVSGSGSIRCTCAAGVAGIAS